MEQILLDEVVRTDYGQFDIVWGELSGFDVATIPADAQVQWLSWAGQRFGPLNDLLPGSYRLRVSAHGRDAGSNGEFVEHVVDKYLLQFWRSDVAADEILRVGSENAQYWHREIGGRR